MLDLGASLGYFSLRLTEIFPRATCVAIDDDPRLLDGCIANAAERVIHLRKRLSSADMDTLGSCEHFDVVLALNVLHHFEDWPRALNAVMHLGDHTFVETPARTETAAHNGLAVEALYDSLEAHRPIQFARVASHLGDWQRPFWYFDTTKTTLTRAYWDVPEDVPLGGITITSTVTEKIVTFQRKNETREWYAGINLQTYLALNGVWPSREKLASLIETYPRPTPRHGDVQSWNFVVDGQHVRLIDGQDDRAVFEDDFYRIGRIVRGIP
jgi:SAM-dependent methyltransferase